jgi:A/G-specific adenine glycosylase
MKPRLPPFAARVTAWQRRHGRHGLPWQGTRDPYRIWLSEIMLQQTQVATVIPYYERFLARFPTVAALAAAPDEEVMRSWSGLGYYARARNLLRTARIVASEHAGHFPLSIAEIAALPGVGPSTAAAIVAFATGEPHAILDGNVKRVMARHFGIEGAADSAATLARLWAVARSELPATGIEAYTQGLMDLGATVCTRTRPACERCPISGSCVALREGRIGEVPGRKSARVSPLKEVAMIVAVSRGEVLLEKRPPSGIWGGLWSLPEAPADVDPAAWTRKNLALRVTGVQALDPFTHAFTHFRLAVRPWLVHVAGGRAAADAAGSMWIALEDASGAALPAPVKKMLAQLAKDLPAGRPRAHRPRAAGS